jgi:hypothetical protein
MPHMCGYARGCVRSAMDGRYVCEEHAGRLEALSAWYRDLGPKSSLPLPRVSDEELDARRAEFGRPQRRHGMSPSRRRYLEQNGQPRRADLSMSDLLTS